MTALVEVTLSKPILGHIDSYNKWGIFICTSKEKLHPMLWCSDELRIYLDEYKIRVFKTEDGTEFLKSSAFHKIMRFFLKERGSLVVYKTVDAKAEIAS